jgi:hypothetical protein
MQSLDKHLEQAWVEVLAHIYKAVNWKQVAKGRSAYDVFQHRLAIARTRPDVPSAIEKLCSLLSLQAPPLPLDQVDFLRQHEKDAMKILRKMTRILTLDAAKRAKELKKGQKKLFEGGE